MTNAARRLSPAELDALTRRLAARVPRDPSAIAPRASVVDISTRKPLGLRPLDTDEPPERDAAKGAPFRSTLWDNATEEDLASEHSVRGAYQQFDAIMGMVIELHNESVDETNRLIDNECAHRKRIEALEATLAEMKGALTEARGEVAAMRMVQEAARALNRGERGEQGPRGVPGSQGPTGPAGRKGEPGVKAAGFVLDLGGYAATLVSSDGAPAARLSLRPMFELFAQEIAAEDGEA
jgi:hypothetical protein